MDNFYSSVQPFYLILKLLGIFPISYEASGNGQVFKQKFLDVLNCCVSFIIFMFVCAINIDHKNDVMRSSSDIITSAWSFSLLFCMLNVFVLLCYQIMKRNSIVRFFHLVDNFDGKARNLKRIFFSSIIDFYIQGNEA